MHQNTKESMLVPPRLKMSSFCVVPFVCKLFSFFFNNKKANVLNEVHGLFGPKENACDNSGKFMTEERRNYIF